MGDFFQTLAMGAGCGLVIGAAIGGWRFQAAQPALLGAAAGSVIGGAAGIVALLPVNQLAPAAAAMTAVVSQPSPPNTQPARNSLILRRLVATIIKAAIIGTAITPFSTDSAFTY